MLHCYTTTAPYKTPSLLSKKSYNRNALQKHVESLNMGPSRASACSGRCAATEQGSVLRVGVQEVLLPKRRTCWQKCRCRSCLTLNASSLRGFSPGYRQLAQGVEVKGVLVFFSAIKQNPTPHTQAPKRPPN